MTRRMVMAAALALSVGAASLLAQGPGQRSGGPGRGPGGSMGPGGPGPGRPGPGGPGGFGGPPGIFARVQQLDLTDAQREQLRTLAEEGRQGGDPAAGVRAAEQQLHAAVLADTPDLNAIQTLKATLAAGHAAELEHRVAMMQKVAQILTSAQRQELLTMQPPGPRGRGGL
jgi:Spy/CpxP family protein refolding chaperone